MSTLGAINCCVASCTLKKANTWTGVCRVDFGYPEREKGACDIEVDTIETLACVASVSCGPRVFRTFEAFFAFWPRKNWAERKRSGRRDREKGGKKTFVRKPNGFEKPVRQRTSIKSVKLV